LDHTKIEQIIRRTLNLRFRKIKENKNYTPNIPTTHYLQLTIPGIHAKNQVRLFLVSLRLSNVTVTFFYYVEKYLINYIVTFLNHLI
jgi:hypothetical protein